MNWLHIKKIVIQAPSILVCLYDKLISGLLEDRSAYKNNKSIQIKYVYN